MRFCIVTPTVGCNDGQGRVNLEIAMEAERQGHEVVLVAERASGLSPGLEKRSIILRPPAWLPTRLLRDQLFAWRTLASLSRDRRGYDAVLANGFVTWARCDVNAVHFVHQSWLRSTSHPWRLRRSARSFYARAYSGVNVVLERFAFRRSGRLAAVSASVANDLRHNNMRIPGISVILNGVNTEEFYPGPAERGKLGLPGRVKLALFAGDLKSPRKNLDTVLHALAMVPGLHLAVAGREDGTPYPEIARTLGVRDRVHFLGFRRDMPALMRTADLFVFPSRYEPFGLVLLEALASGMPVVTARSAGGSELIDPAVGVVLENCDDVRAMAVALQSLILDDNLRQAMASNARTLAERYSWTAMARQYVDLLMACAYRRGRSGSDMLQEQAS